MISIVLSETDKSKTKKISEKEFPENLPSIPLNILVQY